MHVIVKIFKEAQSIPGRYHQSNKTHAKELGH